MAEFRTKLLTLAGIATMFTGMAHAQVTGCTTSSNAVFVAAEGTNEQVADLQISCPALASGSATMNVQVYLSPAVSITSATVGTGGSAPNEATIGNGVLAPAGLLTGTVPGVVSGSSVTFNNIEISSGAPINLVITNIKINASQIATTSGAPTAVTETVFIGGTNVTPAVLSAANVAFATNGLANVKTKKADLGSGSIANVSICSGITAFGAGSQAFQVEFSEGFATAFKVKGSAAANVNVGSQLAANSYTGLGVTGSGTSTNTATSGTRIQIVFNNIPANTNVYVPLTVSLNNGATPPVIQSTLTLVTSATGAENDATGSTANGAPGASDNTHAGAGTHAQLTVSSGSATAIYEETLNNSGAVETYDIPVFLQASGAAITAPQGPMTATVSFAPVGSSSNVPNFVSGSSTTTANGPAFEACTTTLLFPFVTNQLGFDTGVAIANTSSDLLNGGTKSKAANQSGTCTLNFFGDGAPADAVVTDNIAAGATYANAASAVAPGFQGYMIASCNFLYGHGFAYVVYNLTENNGAAMGYLAQAISNDRKVAGSATSTVSSTNPE
jgi:hypothetical protein